MNATKTKSLMAGADPLIAARLKLVKQAAELNDLLKAALVQLETQASTCGRDTTTFQSFEKHELTELEFLIQDEKLELIGLIEREHRKHSAGPERVSGVTKRAR